MQDIHNSKLRMPVVVSAEDYATWLDAGASFQQINTIINQSQNTDFQSHVVSNVIYKQHKITNSPDAQKPINTESIDNQSKLIFE